MTYKMLLNCSSCKYVHIHVYKNYICNRINMTYNNCHIGVLIFLQHVTKIGIARMGTTAVRGQSGAVRMVIYVPEPQLV